MGSVVKDGYFVRFTGFIKRQSASVVRRFIKQRINKMYPKIIRVFIASPSDVQNDRELVKKAISDLNAKFENIYDVILQSVGWEAFRPDVTDEYNPDIQRPITRRMEKCYWFVGIVSKRYGTPVGETNQSGTHQEFRFALQNRDKIKILTYYRIDPSEIASQEDIDQAYKLNILKKELSQAGVRYKTYQSSREFDRMITLDLMEALLELTSDIKRRELLAKFFHFGLRNNQRETSVLIGYPPIHKHWGPNKQYNYNWTERLLPNVIYDDFKCIQKLESALRYLGISDYGSITVPHSKLLDPPGNRMWLCIPRNDFAQKVLNDFGPRVRFKFEFDNNSKSRYLMWKPINQSKSIRVNSPLARYLRLGRPNKETGWHPDFGYITGKDYAVIGRFKYDTPVRGTSFYHYFFAGIRGLGTWGAGWFVDNCYDTLAQIAEKSQSDDIQLLLEVTFRNYRIENVIDVSDKDQEYFDTKNSDEVISDDYQNHIKSNPLAPVESPKKRH